MVLFLSFPRSGSTVCALFLQKQVNVLSLKELFNENKLGISQAAEAVPEVKKIKNPLQNKIEILNKIQNYADKNNYNFFGLQLFYNHVTIKELEEIVNIFDPYVIFLTRRRIDANISRQKSNKLKSWGNTDTTGYKINFNFEHYANQSKYIDDWMAEAHKLIINKKINHSTLIYEKVTEKSLKDLDKFFNKNLNNNKIKYESVDINDKDLVLKKQDKESNFLKKVSNTEELRKYIKNNPQAIRPYMYSDIVKNASCDCFKS